MEINNNIAPRIFLFPWLAYGHISPFLELAKSLSKRGFYIYLCSTPINLKSVNKKITKISHLPIEVVELLLPCLPELPNPQHHTTNGLPRHLIPTLRNALKMAKPTLLNILKSINPNLIIHDALVPWMASLSAGENIPAVRFLTSSTAAISYFVHASRHPQREFPFPAARLGKFEQGIVQRMVEALKGAKDTEDELFPQGLSNNNLIKSSREIEGKYMEYFSCILNSKIVPVGPLVVDDDDDDQIDQSTQLIEWLGKKSEYSTVLVSFGSEYYLKKEEIEEIAYGLELSQANFIWVIRFQDGESTNEVKNVLPHGFLERIGDRGIVCDGWVPQVKILSHESIGGFVSHCGWNSTLESLGFGVPLIAMPMHLDQFLNGKLMVEIGVGVEIMRDENDGKFLREEIAKVIKDVIFGTMGKQVKKQIKDMRRKVKTREKEDIEEACSLLAQICKK